jgi:hypothetical protein
MSNHITIELCAEDRARLDRLAEALERRACDRCVSSALKIMDDVQKQAEPDPIRQQLAEVLARDKERTETPQEPAQEPAEATEIETPATTPAEDESPAEKPQDSEEAPAVTVDHIRQKYVAMVASGKKDEARDIIKSYNVAKISDIPADKCAEVLAKLNALEG